MDNGCRAIFSDAMRRSQRSAARIVWRAPGSPVVRSPFPLRQKNEGARNAGVTLDPRASKPRGFKAARSRAGRVDLSVRATGFWPAAPQVRRNLRRPARGVYRLAPHDPRWADLSGLLARDALRTKPYPPLWELTACPRYDAAGTPAAISRDARLAHRDHTAWAAMTNGTCHPPRPPHQPHRASPVWSRRGDGASPPPPLRPSPRSSALERAPFVGTGRSFLIFL